MGRMGTELEVSFGEVDIRAVIPAAKSEGKHEVGVPTLQR